MLPPKVKCILWDFGDTLVDESFMFKQPDGLPDWTRAWSVVWERLSDGWMRGDVSSDAVSAALADELVVSSDDALALMKTRCRSIEFFELPYRMAISSVIPGAIVTLNPDIFSEVIDPHYRLSEDFDLIVTSWEESTLDKGLLCKIALERLEQSFKTGEALLIDNSIENVKAWMSLGGLGYHFLGEAQFAKDIADNKSIVSQLRKSV